MVNAKKQMKYKILLLTLLTSSFCFSQSIWKKQADLRKRNDIKETKIFQQSPLNSEQKRLWDWELYDINGRLVESKRFLPNGKLNTKNTDAEIGQHIQLSECSFNQGYRFIFT